MVMSTASEFEHLPKSGAEFRLAELLMSPETMVLNQYVLDNRRSATKMIGMRRSNRRPGGLAAS